MTDVELAVAQSFERIFPVPVVSAEWDDVVSRSGARKGRRRRGVVVAIAIAVFVGALLVTPALGIGGRLVDLIRGSAPVAASCGACSGLVVRRAQDRLRKPARRQQGDLRRERRREQAAEPDAQPGSRLGSYLVA